MKKLLKSEYERELIIGQIKRLDLSLSYYVDISRKKQIRTIPQNKLYRLWLGCIAYETGNDADELHDFFKEKYLEPEIKTIFGQQVKRYTTTTLNTIQFKNYLDKIQVFAARELSITLPDPESKYWEEFLEYYTDKI